MKPPNLYLILQCGIRSFNQCLKPFCFGGLTLAALACSPNTEPPPPPAIPTHLLAQELADIRVLQIAEHTCADVLRHNLLGHGYPASDGRQVGAILRLQLSQQRPVRESLPLIQTLGQQANYRADLLGSEGQTLLSLYGREGSLSFSEMCDDIGDEIADKLADYLP